MYAERRGQTVVLTMTPDEARHLEDELLWASDSHIWSSKTWEALNARREREGHHSKTPPGEQP